MRGTWAVLCALCMASTATCITVTSVPRPTIIETDIGSYMDDTWAIFFILSQPELFDVRLIVVSTDNVTARAQVAAKTLANAGFGHIPLALGPGLGGEVTLAAWASDYDLGSYPGGVTPASGTQDLLASTLAAIPPSAPALFLQLSPPLAQAALLTSHQALAGHMSTLIMGGSLWACYALGSDGPCKEYNAAKDPAATATVFRVPTSSWAHPLRLVPVAPSRQFAVNGSAWQALEGGSAGGRAFPRVINASFSAWWEAGGGASFPVGWPYGPRLGTSALYDLVAAVAAVELTQSTPHPPALQWESVGVAVNGTGFTLLCDPGEARGVYDLPCTPLVAARSWSGSGTLLQKLRIATARVVGTLVNAS